MAANAAWVMPQRSPVPGPGATGSARGAAVDSARAVARLGGERARTWKALRWEREVETKRNDGTRRDGWQLTIAEGRRVRLDQSWGASRFSMVADGDGGFFLGSNGIPESMHASGVAELQRDSLACPAWLLRHSGDADFFAAHAGTDRVDDRDVDLVRVAHGRVAVTLAIAQDDGELLQLRRQCRGPRFWFGDETRTYRDFVDVAGLRLPRTVAIAFDGTPRIETQGRVEVDPDLPADWFARPTR
jgi:hypothetical protein